MVTNRLSNIKPIIIGPCPQTQYSKYFLFSKEQRDPSSSFPKSIITSDTWATFCRHRIYHLSMVSFSPLFIFVVSSNGCLRMYKSFCIVFVVLLASFCSFSSFFLFHLLRWKAKSVCILLLYPYSHVSEGLLRLQNLSLLMDSYLEIFFPVTNTQV